MYLIVEEDWKLLVISFELISDEKVDSRLKEVEVKPSEVLHPESANARVIRNRCFFILSY